MVAPRCRRRQSTSSPKNFNGVMELREALLCGLQVAGKEAVIDLYEIRGQSDLGSAIFLSR